MWWGCVIFLVLGVVIGFIVAATVADGKIKETRKRYRRMITNYAETVEELEKDINFAVEELKSARYCIEDGECVLEELPNWLYNIQENIEIQGDEK